MRRNFLLDLAQWYSIAAMNFLLLAVIFAADDSKSYGSRLFSPENLPNIGLFFAGVAGIIVAICTLKIIGRQTVAIEKQADAQVNSERAWIIAELTPMAVKFNTVGWCRRVGSGWAAMSTEEVTRGEHLVHKLKFTNMGRTPAHILRYQIGYSRDVDATGAELRMIDTKHSETVFDRLLGGDDSIEVEDIDAYQHIRDSIEAVGDTEATGIFSGWVEYQHVFSDTEVVKVSFAYLYTPSTMRLVKIPMRKTDKTKKKQPTN